MANDITISRSVFDFFDELAQNNNRDWFTARKSEFKDHETEVKGFMTLLNEALGKHDQIAKMKMFRIYRDVRFSKDKTPYKTHFAASFARAGAARRGGYYICIKPGGSFVASGFWDPNKEDLFRIRKELEMDASPLRHIIDDENFNSVWGKLQGESLKTAPKGFDKEHPDIDLIRHKQFIFTRHFNDETVLSPGFLETVDGTFKAIRPYFDFMSSVLTTNLNGESLID